MENSEEVILEARRRKEEELNDLSMPSVSRNPSWGERLLHGLFAGMEACWFVAIVIGLASAGFFGGHEPFIALWSPFVVLIGASLVMRSSLRQTATSKQDRPPGAALIYVLLAITILLVIWSSVYVNTSFFLNPVWLLALVNDLLLLSSSGYHIIGIILVLVYLCWRGVRIGRYDVEPDSVSRGLFVGMGIILAVVLLQGASPHAVTSTYDLVLLLLIPLFLSLTLITHALANTVFMRKSSRGRFQGSVRAQERSLLLAVVGVGVVLLFVGLVFGTAVSPAFLSGVQSALSPLGKLYDLLAQGLAYVAVAIFMPIEWLIEQMHLKFQPVQLPPQTPIGQQHPRQTPPPESVIATMEVIKVVLPIVGIALVLVLIWLVLRVRRAKLKGVENDEEEHESLWSWELFWSQVKALLQALLAFLWRRSPGAARGAQAEEDSLRESDPAARDIREIYRAMLKFVAGQGIPRKQNETPYELQERVAGKYPQVEQSLNIVTDAYTRVRYGEHVPDSHEVELVRAGWQVLQHKVKEQGQTTS